MRSLRHWGVKENMTGSLVGSIRKDHAELGTAEKLCHSFIR